MEKKTMFGKRLLSFMTSAVLIAGAVPLTASAEPEELGLWVGGVEVTKVNAADILGGGEASYNNLTKELHLKKDIPITGYNGAIYQTYGNFQDLTICVDDDVTLGSDDNRSSRAICVESAGFTIEGEGKLNINGYLYVGHSGGLVFKDADVEIDCDASYGIELVDHGYFSCDSSYVDISSNKIAIYGSEYEVSGYSLTDCKITRPEGAFISHEKSDDPLYTYNSDGTYAKNITILPTVFDPSLTVVWDDDDNKGETRPENITANLLADDEETGKSVVLDESGMWRSSCEELPVFDGDRRIEYSWEVNAPAGYTVDSVEEEWAKTSVTLRLAAYFVDFDANGGIGEMSEMVVYKGDKLKLPECTFESPGCNEFANWSEGEVGDEIEVTSNMVITANWTKKHVPTEIPEQPAGCLNEGYREYYVCENCGRMFEDEECTKEITDLESIKIPAKGHKKDKAVRENEIPAECNETGSYDEVVYCKEFGEELSRKSKSIPELGHDWGDWTVIVEPTEDAEGFRTHDCERCGMTENENMPKLEKEEKPDDVTTADEDIKNKDDKQTSDSEDGKGDNEGKKPDDGRKPDDDFLLGDVNGDGVINVTDIVKAAAQVKGVKELSADETKRADVNLDNSINVVDISKIAAHVKGIKKLG